MRVAALARCLLGLVPLAVAGCAQNPYILQRQVQAQQQQQTLLAQQSQQVQQRAAELDQHNQELSTLLAQSRQQTQMLQDQLAATREQLGSAADQVAELRESQQSLEKRTETLTASTRRRASASISANNSFQDTLPSFGIPGVLVRRDGDVIRVELPADKLFAPGGSQLQAGAGRLVEDVAEALARDYPDHFIGIEGHSDSEPARGGVSAAGGHQLSVARAGAVFEQLAGRTRLRPSQLFVAGHGGNHPVVSNATPAGRQRNNRIELVIYPEQVSLR